MKNKNNTSKKTFYFSLIGLVFLGLTSCGTYQNTTYDDDGIYASNNTTRQVAVEETQPESNKYQDYFKREADKYEDIGENDIFTDVDSYSYDDGEYYEEGINTGNSPWEYTDNVTVNIHSGFGWNNG
ncbi:MAG TPA: hypothetical protein DEO36_08090, partial [Flavobacteriaceae bacterium]|nr:hypothetical protein [Flavobacteriaceae bacterium]